MAYRNRTDSSTGGKRPDDRAPRKYSGQEISLDSSRAMLLLAIFAGIVLVFVFRLVFLQVIVADEYSAQAREARTTTIELSPRRGTIYDRNGTVLATTVDATTIYCNPHEVTDASGEAEKLASILGGEAKDYRDKLQTADTPFAYLKRKADAEKAAQLKEMDLGGIYFINDSRRVYPNDQIGGQVIGFVNIDDEGLSGLELYYNDILTGTPGRMVAERGEGGIPIPGGVTEDTNAVNGQDIIVSLDLGMQGYLEDRLAQGVKDLEGKGGNSVIMDGGTGEILACASLPYLNPSDRSKVEAGATELKSITTAFEPGSIFKAVPILGVLEAGLMTPDDTLFCPAYLPADEYFVSDAHERGDETMSLRKIFANSSNVGLSLAASKLTFPVLYDKILQYNFNEETGVDYPGEAAGYLLNQKNWSTIQAYNISFGQGISVTPLQMARFYGALTNKGIECTPHFLIAKPQNNETLSYPTEDVVMNKAAIPAMTSLLESVVTDGTGKPAAIDGYSVAGKTGTAEYADDTGGYVKGFYNISFIGYMPHSNSQLVCFVGATEVPGDRSTAAVFKDIMAFAIDRYKITPQ
ncbi:MAG: penicillin-binding protein 2 [Raoultibacter sp.]